MCIYVWCPYTVQVAYRHRYIISINQSINVLRVHCVLSTLGQPVSCKTVQMVTQTCNKKRNVMTIKIEIGWESEVRVIAQADTFFIQILLSILSPRIS